MLTMVAVLLALGLFIVLLQLGVMTLVRRLAQQLELERARIDKLERAAARAVAGMADFVPTLTPQPESPRKSAAAAPQPATLATPATPAAAAAAAAPAVASPAAAPSAGVPEGALAAAGAEPRVDPNELRGEMLGLMRQLVDQGLSVRDIASRCGLSEAEAELMLSLHGGERD